MTVRYTGTTANISGLTFDLVPPSGVTWQTVAGAFGTVIGACTAIDAAAAATIAPNPTNNTVVTSAGTGTYTGPLDLLSCTFDIGSSVTTAPASGDFTIANATETVGETSPSITSDSFSLSVNNQ